MNQQPPTKQVHAQDGSLLLHSVFSTIQGEGPYTGHRAIFVRLAGCNLQCPLCDTEYTDGATQVSPMFLLGMVEGARSFYHHVQESDKVLVVITGGEPFRQNIEPFIRLLLANNFEVQIETNGTLYKDLPFALITTVCSPKSGSLNTKLAPYLRLLKYVIKSGEVSEVDGLPLSALDHPAKPQLARPPANFEGIIYIQPADEKDEVKNQANLRAAVKSALQYGYVLQLQVHKLIGVE